MSQLDHILHLLSDGQFHSGEKIGNTLGVTRSAVWQTLKRLLDPNLELQAIRKRGYRIPGGLELLNEEVIRSQLGDQQKNLPQLELLQTVNSTNTHLLLKKNLPSGYTVFAEQQTEGRGRFGRTWVSPFGRNLYLSMAWNFPGGTTTLAGLSLVIGIAVVNALESYGLTGIKLKWPNDIIYHQRKLGGILVEVTGDVTGLCQAIIGIGINVQAPQTLNTAIDQSWIDIRNIKPHQPQRNKLGGLILKELLTVLPEFQQKGLQAFRSYWQPLDAFAGQPVTVHTQQGPIEGIADGIDQVGNLRVIINGEAQTFNSGEVSIRRLVGKTDQ